MIRKKGFTLIELLVVIAIIALLLSVIMPALKKAKEQMKDVSCRNNLRQITLAFALYSEDYNGRTMEMDYGDKYWFLQIAPYLGDRDFKYNPSSEPGSVMKVGVCPSTKIVVDSTGYGTYNETWHFSWGTAKPFVGSYGVNSWVLEDKYGWFPGDKRFFDHNKYSFMRSDIPVVADAFWVDSWPMDVDTMPANRSLLKVPPAVLPHAAGSFMWRFCVDRHNLAINVGFKGTQVEKVPLNELWTLKWNSQFKSRYDVVIPNR